MMKTSRIAILLVVALAAAGCTDQYGPKQTGGTLIGAGLGGLAGAQFGGGKGALAMTALGALGGAFLGSEVGKSLDRADRTYMAQTTQTTLETAPSGHATTWRNPDSGNYGTITPTRTYQVEDRYCREYQQTVTVGGRSEQAFGRACRNPDGTWQIVQ
jgi:surface antigen